MPTPVETAVVRLPERGFSSRSALARRAFVLCEALRRGIAQRALPTQAPLRVFRLFAPPLAPLKVKLEKGVTRVGDDEAALKEEEEEG